MKAASRIVLTAALMVSIGLHWAVMQSVAWVGMAVSYSVKSGSVLQGLSETFDGDHPCPLCHAVEGGVKKSSPSQDQKEPNSTKTDKDLKLHLIANAVSALVFQTPPAPEWTTMSQVAVSRRDSPEAPPPRPEFLA